MLRSQDCFGKSSLPYLLTFCKQRADVGGGGLLSSCCCYFGRALQGAGRGGLRLEALGYLLPGTWELGDFLGMAWLSHGITWEGSGAYAARGEGASLRAALAVRDTSSGKGPPEVIGIIPIQTIRPEEDVPSCKEATRGPEPGAVPSRVRPCCAPI